MTCVKKSWNWRAAQSPQYIQRDDQKNSNLNDVLKWRC